MPTKFKPLITKRVGHVPFHSIQSKDDKGMYVVSGKFNGTEYVGTGTSERLAAIDFKKQTTESTINGKVNNRG